VSNVPGRRHLRSARRGELDFPRVNLATCGGRAFAYDGPTYWNSLPDRLDRDLWDVDSGGSKESYIKWDARWLHLANTIDPSICGADPIFLSNYFDHCYCYVLLNFCQLQE